MRKSNQKKAATKKDYLKIEKIVKDSFDEVSKMVNRSKTDQSKSKIGTIVFS